MTTIPATDPTAASVLMEVEWIEAGTELGDTVPRDGIARVEDTADDIEFVMLRLDCMMDGVLPFEMLELSYDQWRMHG